MPSRRSRRGAERGAAVADFVLVSGLVVVMFVAAFQLGLALHVRNTLISCAAEGARYGATIGASPAMGAGRTEDLIDASLSSRFAADVSAGVEVVDGVQVVAVRVRAPLPVLGPLGPDNGLDVVGRAFLETQP